MSAISKKIIEDFRPDGLDDLRERAEAATQGVWIAVGREVENADDELPDICSTIDRPALDDSDTQQCADAAYIAAANPDTIMQLLTYIERLESALK